MFDFRITGWAGSMAGEEVEVEPGWSDFKRAIERALIFIYKYGAAEIFNRHLRRLSILISLANKCLLFYYFYLKSKTS